MKIVETFAAVRSEIGGTSAALVPTMGFLHEGHMSLLELAKGLEGPVVMSLFVNPLQFDRSVDLERYPRDLDRDAQIATAAGVDLLFAPTVEEMYPSSPRTRVRVDSVSEGMEGEHRPGHFEGVATVVAKLFAGIRPDAAVFGRKDAQQLAVVRRMTADLSFPVEIIGAPTVRAPDGLAVSSRNVFITEDDRAAALGLSSGLFAAAEAVAAGERNAVRLESLVRGRLTDAEVEYVTLADAFEAEPLDTLDREAFLAVAARVGEVRLIDNIVLWPDGSTDTGVRLEGPSILRRA
ncbi:MAG: pantoate--beta-alanine ligase [Acidimicrobiia bacterium]